VSADTPSRPLPRITVDQPSAERGADDARAHLDAEHCSLCGCPDVDRVVVEIPWTGKTALRPVCKGHSEHPDHPGYAESENPVDYRECERCGALGEWSEHHCLCLNCKMDFSDEEMVDYLNEARSHV